MWLKLFSACHLKYDLYFLVEEVLYEGSILIYYYNLCFSVRKRHPYSNDYNTEKCICCASLTVEGRAVLNLEEKSEFTK